MSDEIPLLSGRPAWHRHAACRRAGPGLFFPARGDRGYEQSAYARARALCATCPVIARCAAYAESARPQHGMWAGLTPGQRKRRRRRGPQEPSGAPTAAAG